jgi:DNA (cytosine-5)-methyltransferase 1
MMRHLDLFSGIGGFALACRMVGGIQTVGFCEREPYAQRVLKKHWPDVPICNDIHDMKGNEYGPIDLVTGGFPCQPYSLAGERRGNEDDRALWPQMLRIIREATPTWILGENVAGIIPLALDGVLSDLEIEGYACEAFCLPACAVDAKHRRDRIWIVGHSSMQCRNDFQAQGERKYKERWELSTGGSSSVVVCNTSSERLPDWAGGTVGQPCPITEFERPSGREIERDFRGVAHGVSKRVDRLRGLGNSIVPQVACEIIRCIKAADQMQEVES